MTKLAPPGPDHPGQPDQPGQSDQTDVVVGARDPDQRYTRRLLLGVMLAVMGFGSLMTIVTVSLATIAVDLHTSRATLGWVVTGLMLAMAVATPLAGKLGDIRGSRSVFLWGLAGGVVTTALCGLAWNATSLIVFRVLFGLSGALVMPNGMSLMMDAYGPARRASAVGWFQFAMTGAPTIGLVVGGPLIDVIGWRALFFSFVGVTVAALALGALWLRETPRQADLTLDYQGAVSLGLGVLAMLLAVTRGATLFRSAGAGTALTDALLLSLLLAAGLAFAVFVRTERRARHPMLKLTYFRRRRFTAPLVANALCQYAYMGGFVVVPLLLGDVYGWTVGSTALILAPRPGAFSVVAPFGGRLAGRYGERLPMVAGGACMVASMVAFALSATGGAIALVVVGLTLSGVASGLSSPGTASMVAGAVDREDLGIANGMSQQVQFIGIVAGIQTMLVALGDHPSTSQYASTFLFGAAVAFLGLLAALAAKAVGAPRALVAPHAALAVEPAYDTT
jgi:MFS family permease